MRQDILQHIFRSRQHVRIPVADHAISISLQKIRSGKIPIRFFGVLAAVQFDDQLGLAAKEIDNEAVNGDLSPEFPATELAIANEAPKLRFGLCRPSP